MENILNVLVGPFWETLAEAEVVDGAGMGASFREEVDVVVDVVVVAAVVAVGWVLEFLLGLDTTEFRAIVLIPPCLCASGVSTREVGVVLSV